MRKSLFTSLLLLLYAPNSFAFMTGTYRCLRYFVTNANGTTVNYNTVCALDTSFFIHKDGTYSKSTESGSYSISGNQITFSESKVRGPGTIDILDNQITFSYYVETNLYTITYYLVSGTEEGEVGDTSSESAASDLATLSGTTIRVRADNGGCCIKPEMGIGGTLSFIPRQSGNVTVKVFAPSGEIVTQTTLQVNANVSVEVGWNGRNLDGNKPVASGVYVVHVEGGGVNSTQKIAVIK